MARIRQAREDDIPSILDLYRQLSLSGGEEKDSAPAETFSQAYRDISGFPGYDLLVAEEDGRVVGTLVLLIVPNLSHNARRWAAIENVVVEHGRRGQGIGKMLMEYAHSRAGEAGCYKVQLMSDNRRDGAHEFYEALGYRASAKGFRLYL